MPSSQPCLFETMACGMPVTNVAAKVALNGRRYQMAAEPATVATYFYDLVAKRSSGERVNPPAIMAL